MSVQPGSSVLYQQLDNIVWHALSGPQACFAEGGNTARRYAPGFSPILGFADNLRPDFDALVAHCGKDEHFYTDGWAGAAPPGWAIELDSTMFKMVWRGETPRSEPAPHAIALRPEHAEQALVLAELTRPGPFAIRTIELGDYFGYFDGDRLVAMAGERMFAGIYREVSGVCTHPDYLGRGYGRKLTLKLVRRHLARGEIPFLHVMRDNSGARRLYRTMGFIDYLESPVRVVRRVSRGA